MNLWLPFVFSFLFQTLISATINHIAHILLSLSRLGGRVVDFSFGQELYDMRGILKNFAPLKNILCPPPPLPPAVMIVG